jgi:CheY-like chemotaxis protein
MSFSYPVFLIPVSLLELSFELLPFSSDLIQVIVGEFAPLFFHLAFDLLPDVIMPGRSGVELATIIRDKYPGLPVVLTSGYSSVLAENMDHGLELIQKPYSVEALSRILRRAISARPLQD